MKLSLLQYKASTLSDVDTVSMNHSGITSLTDPGSLSLAFHRCRGKMSTEYTIALRVIIIVLCIAFHYKFNKHNIIILSACP